MHSNHEHIKHTNSYLHTRSSSKHEKHGTFDDRDEAQTNTTNKSESIRGDDSFYDPTAQTRMASIHPRPTIIDHDDEEDETANDEQMICTDEVMNYWVASQGQAVNNGHIKVSAAQQQEEEMQYGYENVTPPQQQQMQLQQQRNHFVQNKLTPVSAYDRSLAATPSPQQQYEYAVPLQRAKTDPFAHLNNLNGFAADIERSA